MAPTNGPLLNGVGVILTGWELMFEWTLRHETMELLVRLHRLDDSATGPGCKCAPQVDVEVLRAEREVGAL